MGTSILIHFVEWPVIEIRRRESLRQEIGAIFHELFEHVRFAENDIWFQRLLDKVEANSFKDCIGRVISLLDTGENKNVSVFSRCLVNLGEQSLFARSLIKIRANHETFDP